MRAEERVKQAIREGIQRGDLAGGAAMVIQNGEEVLFCQEGYADVWNEIPYKKDTIVRMYSMSKPITAAAAMILMDRGQLDLADEVMKYLPGFAQAKVQGGEGLVRPVYIRDLLAMTAGLSYPGENDEAQKATDKLFNELYDRLYTDNAMSTIELANRLGSDCPLAFQPGTHFRYSTCADVMGAVIEVITGMSYGEFLQKEIFEPLGMKDTGFVVPEEKQSRQAKVYEFKDGQYVEKVTNHLGIRYLHDGQPAFESGGAGLASTLVDYAKFAQMVLNKGVHNGKRILSERAVEMMSSGQLEYVSKMDLWDWSVSRWGYNYGFFNRVMEEPGKAVMYGTLGEFGWDGWLGTHYMNDPVHNLTFLFVMQGFDAGSTSTLRRIRNIIATEYTK